jgi:hypothetical protein
MHFRKVQIKIWGEKYLLSEENTYSIPTHIDHFNEIIEAVIG